MGTRGLTMVIHEEKTKVAQYGQWDHYPSGQGVHVLNFLKTKNLNQFKEQLKKIKFIDEEKDKEIDEFMKSIGSKDGWMTSEQAEKYHKAYPYLTRDHGAAILDRILESTDDVIWLRDSTDFAGDSLFCEYAYVIDLDKEKFEVYQGFNQQPLEEGERFKNVKVDEKSEYTPVRKIKEFDFNDLPTEDDFVSQCEGEDEE